MLNNYSCVYTTGSSCVIKIVIPSLVRETKKANKWHRGDSILCLRKSFFSVGSSKGKGSFEATGESYAKGSGKSRGENTRYIHLNAQLFKDLCKGGRKGDDRTGED